MREASRRAVRVLDTGLTRYAEAWKWQQMYLQRRIAGLEVGHRYNDVMLVLEHPDVYTLGRSATPAHLKFPRDAATELGCDVHDVDRGGKVTYHGPGQLVVYPLLDLRNYKQDLHWYVWCIEESLIRCLARYGVSAGRLKGFPGVWVVDDTRRIVGGSIAPLPACNERKIAQVGMSCSKWYTSHGGALNVAPRMDAFQRIVPCGIDDRPVTSLAAELQLQAQQGGSAAQPSFAAVKAAFLAEAASVFDCDFQVPIASSSSSNSSDTSATGGVRWMPLDYDAVAGGRVDHGLARSLAVAAMQGAAADGEAVVATAAAAAAPR